jgi:hypothetical protein
MVVAGGLVLWVGWPYPRLPTTAVGWIAVLLSGLVVVAWTTGCVVAIDSPAGLAAWILEKWCAWSDSDGDLEMRFSREFLHTMFTLYWVTETITPSMRDYFDNRWHGADIQPGDRVQVPVGFAYFDNNHVSEGSPPREWAKRASRRWTVDLDASVRIDAHLATLCILAFVIHLIGTLAIRLKCRSR